LNIQPNQIHKSKKIGCSNPRSNVKNPTFLDFWSWIRLNWKFIHLNTAYSLFYPIEALRGFLEGFNFKKILPKESKKYKNI
jgi:hypothetical protein